MSDYYGKSVVSIYNDILKAKEYMYIKIKEEYPQLEKILKDDVNIDFVMENYNRLLSKDKVDYNKLDLGAKQDYITDLVQDLCFRYNLESIDFGEFDVNSHIGVNYYSDFEDSIDRGYIVSISEDMCFELDLMEIIDIDDIYDEKELVLNNIYENLVEIKGLLDSGEFDLSEYSSLKKVE